VSFTLADDIGRDLVVAVQSISFTGHSQAVLLSDPIYAFIDSTDPNIWLPAAACAKFEEAFGISLDNATGLYLVNDTQHAALLAEDAEVTIRIGDGLTGGASVAITMPYSAFALTATYPMVENSSYYFPLKQATDQSQYTLGRVFLQEAYLTVDYERGNFSVSQCIWDIEAKQDIATIHSLANSDDSSDSGDTTDASSPGTPDNSGPSTGAIAGIVVGSSIGLTVFAVAIWWYVRKRSRKTGRGHVALRSDDAADEQTTRSIELAKGRFAEVQELNNGAAVQEMENTMIIGEAGGAALYELDARPRTHEMEGEVEDVLMMRAASRLRR
jgi:FlaG/FlaF family flagellin (archaellin)